MSEKQSLSRRSFLRLGGGGIAGAALAIGLRRRSEGAEAARARPNVIFIYTDDMGFGDPNCYGGMEAPTPNIDRLASEGVRFTQFYAPSPICSPSRVGVTTGMFPARWRINDYLHQRRANHAHEQGDWLDPKAPSLARTLKEAGYATAHFGKWHMGGGRDVTDAPLPSAYGFDESLVSSHPLEGLGPALDRKLPRHETSRAFVDKTIEFVRRAKDKPFYINLWPMDVHSPHVPDPELLPKYADAPRDHRKFDAVLDEYDYHLGRLFDFLRDAGLDERTLVIFSSDNGPQPSFDHQRSAGLRGQKWSLYEGGVRTPFIVRWTGVAPAGKVDDTTVIGGVDLFPSVCALAGVALPKGVEFDGEDMSAAMLGRPTQRDKPLLWEYGRKPDYLKPPLGGDRSPNVAIRDKQWKLLVNADGSRQELYDVLSDPNETRNLASANPEIAQQLARQALAWRKSLP